MQGERGPERDLTGAVLAGGSSRRMGGNKLAIPVDGVPLVERALEAVAAVATDVLLVRRPGRPIEGVAPVGRAAAREIVDTVDGAGPLAGIHAALQAARHDLVLVVGGDMPFLSPAVLRHLAARAREAVDADAVALGDGSRPQPLLAVYRRRSLAVVEQMLESRALRLSDLLAQLALVVVEPAEWATLDPTGRTPLNLNRPADVAALKR